MAPREKDNRTRLWRRVVGFLLDWLKSLGLYAIVVALGTFLFLAGSSAVGYLAYSDPPGPGWYGRGVLNWHEVGFFVSWALLLLYFCLYSGAPLFPFARVLGWLRSPLWVVWVFGGLFAAAGSLIAVLAAGWYIAISEYPAYVGAAAGLLYGALVLPRFAGPVQSRRRTWKNWSGIVATILACGAFVLYPLLPRRPEQSIEVLFVRVVPGPEPLGARWIGWGGLTEDELKLLKSLELTGSLRFGLSAYHGATPTQARAVIVFTEPLNSRVELRQPKQTRVVYVQQRGMWKMYPPDAPTIRQEIKFWPSKNEPDKIEGQIDSAKPTAFSWYPPLGSR